MGALSDFAISKTKLDAFFQLYSLVCQNSGYFTEGLC